MTSQIANHRLHAFQKQSGRCYYCGSHMWLDNMIEFAKQYHITEKEAARFQCTAEHLLARSEGGGNSKNNIVAACLVCNHGRHGRKKPPVPTEYKKFIQRRLVKGKWHPRHLHTIRLDQW